MYSLARFTHLYIHIRTTRIYLALIKFQILKFSKFYYYIFSPLYSIPSRPAINLHFRDSILVDKSVVYSEVGFEWFQKNIHSNNYGAEVKYSLWPVSTPRSMKIIEIRIEYTDFKYYCEKCQLLIGDVRIQVKERNMRLKKSIWEFPTNKRLNMSRGRLNKSCQTLDVRLLSIHFTHLLRN